MQTFGDIQEKDGFENTQESDFERDVTTIVVGTAKREKPSVNQIDMEMPAPDPENNYVSHIVDRY